MTLRINPSNKRKLVANAVSKLLVENRQKHITIEGEERDFNGVAGNIDLSSTDPKRQQVFYHK